MICYCKKFNKFITDDEFCHCNHCRKETGQSCQTNILLQERSNLKSLLHQHSIEMQKLVIELKRTYKLKRILNV